MARKKTRAEHISALTEMNHWVELLGDYLGAHQHTDYFCTRHKLTYKAKPTNVLAGKGLKCCMGVGIQKYNANKHKKALSTYDSELAKQGKLKRIDNYIDSKTPILHICLIHKQEGLAVPTFARAGRGLLCCKEANRVASGVEPRRKKAAASYDQAIKKFGKVVRLEPYVSAIKRILHRCLIHNEEYKAAPSKCRAGGGLQCCREHASKESGARRLSESAARYDNEILEIGKVERIDPYIGSTTPILHKCLIHDEIGLASPRQSRNGCGLWCCKEAFASVDSLSQALNGTRRFSIEVETDIYVYGLKNFPEHSKVGISNCTKNRITAGEYGEEYLKVTRSNRLEAYLLEQAVLAATKSSSHIPEGLATWVGRTEVRKIDPQKLSQITMELVDALDEFDNPWEFALQFIPLGPRHYRKANELIEKNINQE